MVNPRLAARYAKSLIDLAIENKQLEEVKQEVDFILNVFKVSPEFKEQALAILTKFFPDADVSAVG